MLRNRLIVEIVLNLKSCTWLGTPSTQGPFVQSKSSSSIKMFNQSYGLAKLSAKMSTHAENIGEYVVAVIHPKGRS
jgi:hypothetical protein